MDFSSGTTRRYRTFQKFGSWTIKALAGICHETTGTVRQFKQVPLKAGYIAARRFEICMFRFDKADYYRVIMKRTKSSRTTSRTSKRSERRKEARCDPKAVAEFDYSALDPVFAELSRPAQRALLTNGIRTPKELARNTLDEVLKFHGIGASSVPILKRALRANGLKFRADRF